MKRFKQVLICISLFGVASCQSPDAPAPATTHARIAPISMDNESGYPDSSADMMADADITWVTPTAAAWFSAGGAGYGAGATHFYGNEGSEAVDLSLFLGSTDVADAVTRNGSAYGALGVPNYLFMTDTTNVATSAVCGLTAQATVSAHAGVMAFVPIIGVREFGAIDNAATSIGYMNPCAKTTEDDSPCPGELIYDPSGTCLGGGGSGGGDGLGDGGGDGGYDPDTLCTIETVTIWVSEDGGSTWSIESQYSDAIC